MNKNFSIAVVVFIIYLIFAYMFWGSWSPQTSLESQSNKESSEEKANEQFSLPITIPTPTPFKNDIPRPQENKSASRIIEMTPNGFIPQTITVSAGEEVIFTNRAERSMWPASDIHPTHRSYPGSDIAKCRAKDATIFDACRGIAVGESWSFIFTQRGRWTYHDHFNPGKTGVVIVE